MTSIDGALDGAPNGGLDGAPKGGLGGAPPTEASRERRATLLWAALAAATFGATAWLLADHFLIGALLILACVLCGAAAASVLAAFVSATSQRAKTGPVALAVLVAVGLLIPQFLASRYEDLATAGVPLPEVPPPGTVALPHADPELVVLAYPEGGGHAVTIPAGDDSTPTAEKGQISSGGSPTSTYRSLLTDHGTGTTVLSSADGEFLLAVTGEETTVFRLTDTTRNNGESSSGEREDTRDIRGPLPGTPIAVDRATIIMRSCSPDGACTLSGYPWEGTDNTPAWQIREPDHPWYAQADNTILDPSQSPSPATRPVLPGHAVLFDPSQGLIELDPATGFAVGQTLSTPDETCRAAVSSVASSAAAPYQAAPSDSDVVLTLCEGEDGAVTAAAWDRGHLIWQSDPSPAGQWTALADHGLLVAAGTESDTGADGELLAAGSGPWSVPGADADLSTVRARVAMDGRFMSVITVDGDLVLADTRTGVGRSLHDISGQVRGSWQHHDALVILDDVERTHPLHPRDGAMRLRVIEMTSGDVTARIRLRSTPDEVIPVPGGQVIVVTGDRAVLLG